MTGRSKLRYRVFAPINYQGGKAGAGKLVARVHFVEDAAALVALYGDGATIRRTIGGKSVTVWTQGKDGEAGDSYDTVAVLVRLRETVPV